jgi:ABC-type transport system substrate-binding protein
MRFRRSLLFALAFGLSVSAFAAEIRIALSKPPSYYDPRQVGDAVTTEVLSQVYETPLLYTTAQPAGAPNLFSAVTRNDSRTYTATLQPGVVFSDGEPLTATGMVAWLSTVRDIASRGTMVAGSSGKSGTVTFHLKEPDQYFSSLLMMNYCAIAREKAKGVFVGTGPFVLGRHDDHEIVLEKNPRYHEEGQPKVDRLVFRVYPAEPDGTNPKLIEAIQKDEVDFTSAVPLSALPELQSVRTARTLVMESKNTGWISFNLRKPPFNNVRLRRAIQMLIDPDPIVRRLYPVGTRTAASFLPPPLATQVRDVDFDLRLKSDSAAARAELGALGFTAEKKLKINLLILWASRPYCNNPVLFGEMVKKQLEDSGVVEVKTTQPSSGNQYFQSLTQGKFDLAGNGWIADGPNPADFVEANFASSKIGCLSDCNNMGGWVNVAVDRAIREIRSTGSSGSYKALTEEFRKELPLIPIVHGPGVIVLSRRVRGVEPSTFSYVSFRLASLGAS